VKERHAYANELCAAALNFNTEIIFTVDNENRVARTACAAVYLDKVFQHLMSGKPINKLEKWILQRSGRNRLTLDEIKQLIKIEVRPDI
jgi:hypothetical protein